MMAMYVNGVAIEEAFELREGRKRLPARL